jgi:septation ring formation regulator EzrA
MSRPQLFGKPGPSLEDQVKDLQNLVSSMVFNQEQQRKKPTTPCNFTQYYRDLLNSLDPKINSVNQSLQAQIINNSNLLNNMFTKHQQDTQSRLNALNTSATNFTTSEISKLQFQLQGQLNNIGPNLEHKITNLGVSLLDKINGESDLINKRIEDVYRRMKSQQSQQQAIDQSQQQAIDQLQQANTIFDDRMTKLESQLKMVTMDYTCKYRNLEARMDQNQIPNLY